MRSGLTIEQLSELSGVSRQTILNIGSGKHFGDLKTWLKLSRALDVSLDQLLAEVWSGDSGSASK
ncbi:MAG: helix-turn-helix transcriptional regulator [Cryobacterium sp.]|nr:helix-turn-helix transcriptional regulator [Cryobacterium sp.]